MRGDNGLPLWGILMVNRLDMIIKKLLIGRRFDLLNLRLYLITNFLLIFLYPIYFLLVFFVYFLLVFFIYFLIDLLIYFFINLFYFIELLFIIGFRVFLYNFNFALRLITWSPLIFWWYFRHLYIILNLLYRTFNPLDWNQFIFMLKMMSRFLLIKISRFLLLWLLIIIFTVAWFLLWLLIMIFLMLFTISRFLLTISIFLLTISIFLLKIVTVIQGILAEQSLLGSVTN